MKSAPARTGQNTAIEKALSAFRHAMTATLLGEARARGVGLSHYETIRYIAEAGEPSMKDIAARLNVTPPSASAIIDTLVERHLVARKEMPEDRRSVRVILAPKAHAFLSSIDRHKSSVFEDMLSRLDAKDKEEFARILWKCVGIKK